jgi:CTP synthase (UTP-ammonia lyase)
VKQFRCSYELNPKYREAIRSELLKIVGADDEGTVRAIEIPDHRFFVASLYLPQLRSSAGSPQPLVVAYLKATLAGERCVVAALTFQPEAPIISAVLRGERRNECNPARPR